METGTFYITMAIAVIALVTWMLRALPFIIFHGRELPPVVRYLGSVLPSGIMIILVCYFLRRTSFSKIPYGLPEIISCVLVILLQCKKNNMYLSILFGTACYMILIRVM